MKALLKRQAEIEEVAGNLERKFGKVSDANRKESYFKRRLGELKKLTDEYEENHVALMEIDETSDERKAFDTGETYEKVMETLKKAKWMYEAAYEVKFPEKPLEEIFGEGEQPNRTIIIQDDEKIVQLTRKTYAVRSEMVTDLRTKIMAKIDQLNTIIELDYELDKMTTAWKAFEEMVLLTTDEYDLEGMKLEHEDITNIADRVISTDY